MIQLNLLPDVKINYLKSKRNKRLIMGGSLAVIAGSAALFMIMFSLVQVQKKHISDMNTDIAKYRGQLEATEDVGKILTIQNQLNNVDSLHDEKPTATRMVTFLAQVTPSDVSFSNITVDFAANSFDVSGKAKDLATVNKFIDTLKFTTYNSQTGATGNAFSEVVLTSFSKDEADTTYQINFKYAPEIVDNAGTVTLTIPDITSTRSSVERPLFEETSEEEKAE